MPAARYWRIVGVETYAGGDLELSELHLYDASGRVDAAATLTSTIAPAAGTLAALQDDNLGTTCRFEGAAVRSGGFAFVWDFGAGNTADAVGVRLGAAAQDVFMAGCTLQYSTDGAQWVWAADFARYAWPGAGAYTVASTGGDWGFAKVSLLLHFDGADGSTTFTDSSAAPKTVTAHGNAKISTVQSKFGGASAYFDGGGGRLSTTDGAAFDFGGGNFTIEFWLMPTAVSRWAVYVAKRDSGALYAPFVILRKDSDSVISFFAAFVDGTWGVSIEAPHPATNEWSHVAFVRDGSVFKAFLNGVQAGSANAGTSALLKNSSPLNIGAEGDNAHGLVGFIDDLRITKGVARYTANFTPPTVPFPDIVDEALVPPTLHTTDTTDSTAASAPVPTFSTRRAAPLQLARDVEVGGPGTIYGTTKTKGTPNQPAKARVVLLHQRSKQPVREVWSDPITGAFVFEGIDTTQQFLTLAEDAAGNFRPVAASRLVPEVQS